MLRKIYVKGRNAAKFSRRALPGKINGKNRAFSQVTGYPDLCVVDPGGVLDNGEAQSRAAHFFGTALVDTVEALEDPVELPGRNADPVVGDCKLRPVRIISDGHNNAASLFAVMDRVAAQVVDDTVKNLGNPVNNGALTLDGHSHARSSS